MVKRRAPEAKEEAGEPMDTSAPGTAAGARERARELEADEKARGPHEGPNPIAKVQTALQRAGVGTVRDVFEMQEEREGKDSWTITIKVRDDEACKRAFTKHTFVGTSNSKRDAKKLAFAAALESLAMKPEEHARSVKKTRQLEAMLGDKVAGYVITLIVHEDSEIQLTPGQLQEVTARLCSNEHFSSMFSTVFPERAAEMQEGFTGDKYKYSAADTFRLAEVRAGPHRHGGAPSRCVSPSSAPRTRAPLAHSTRRARTSCRVAAPPRPAPPRAQEFEAEVWRCFDRNGRSFEHIIKLFRERGIFNTVPKFSYNQRGALPPPATGS